MSTATLVREAFAQKELKYKEFRELEDGGTLMVAGFNGQMATYDLLMVFDKEDHTVMIRVGRLAKVPIDRQFEVLSALNELNREYRFVSFYSDPEDFVAVQTDRVIAANETADPVMEMIVRVVQILDGAYPRIMKAIWS